MAAAAAAAAAVSDANPFFQEFEATFVSHSVGMRIRKTHDIPVVHELVKTPSGEESPAALAGVPPAAVLIAVAGEHTLRLRYEECIGRISARGRPITLAFRQLHAAIDRGATRRYWQGYLRLKTGDSVWTGLFYVLREDGSFSSFPSKDIEGQTPVKMMRVGGDCTLIHGESLKQFLGGDTAVSGGSGGGGGGSGSSGGGGGSGGGSGSGGGGGSGVHETGGGGGAGAVGAGAGGDAWWLECFAVLAPDGLQLFRAPSPSARLDWVSAFAVVTTAHELGLCKTPPPPPPRPPSPTTTAATAGAAREEESPVAPASSRFGRWGYRGARKSEPEAAEEEDQGGGWGETAAIGGRVAAAGVRGRVTASPPKSVMQGFLRKRAAARSWGSSEGWEYRWVVLRDDGRLLWYLSAPADPWEVPNGYLCLRGARVSFSEGALLRNHLREDEVRGGRLCPFLVDVIEHGDGESGGDQAALQQAQWQQQQQQQQQQQEQLRRRRGRGQQQEARPPDRPAILSSEQPQQQQEGERRVVFLSTWGTEERAEWVEALSK
ncbi:unnamed protein product [Ectocarpus fasciculatus]